MPKKIIKCAKFILESYQKKIKPYQKKNQAYQLSLKSCINVPSFSYLGIPIKPGGLIDYSAMIQHNINKASLTMNQLAAIGLNSTGFPPLLACRFYSQMVRAQLDYGLAISPLTTKLIHQLDTFQNQCIKKVFYSLTFITGSGNIAHFVATCSLP